MPLTMLAPSCAHWQACLSLPARLAATSEMLQLFQQTHPGLPRKQGSQLFALALQVADALQSLQETPMQAPTALQKQASQSQRDCATSELWTVPRHWANCESIAATCSFTAKCQSIYSSLRKPNNLNNVPESLHPKKVAHEQIQLERT